MITIINIDIDLKENESKTFSYYSKKITYFNIKNDIIIPLTFKGLIYLETHKITSIFRIDEDIRDEMYIILGINNKSSLHNLLLKGKYVDMDYAMNVYKKNFSNLSIALYKDDEYTSAKYFLCREYQIPLVNLNGNTAIESIVKGSEELLYIKSNLENILDNTKQSNKIKLRKLVKKNVS